MRVSGWDRGRVAAVARGGVLCLALFGAGPAGAQSGGASSGQSSVQLSAPTGAPAAMDSADWNSRLEKLTESLKETRAELSQSRAEVRELHAMVQQLIEASAGHVAAIPGSAAAPANPARANSAPANPSTPPAVLPPATTAEVQANPAQLTQDDWELTNARIDEQAQDKVESRLKYRVKLSGIVLFNAFAVTGQVDNLDVPTSAVYSDSPVSGGSFGGSLRQSTIGLTGIGPDILGARTSGDVQMDFFGGLPAGYGGGNSGFARLRLARLRMDWKKSSVIAGLDVPFFSPNVPTSYMSLALPEFSASGNLWAWTPSIRFEHRYSEGAEQYKVEAGILMPGGYGSFFTATRYPGSVEASRQPVYSVRVSANRTEAERPFSFGVSGLYIPMRFPGINISGWGALADWKYTFTPHAELSGAFFVGKGLDAFGGVPVAGYSTVLDANYYQVAAPAIEQLTTIGGWTQLKFPIDVRNEFNVGAGTGGRNSSGLGSIYYDNAYLQEFAARNQTLFVNYILKPKSDLVFSVEYRRLRTYPIGDDTATASQIGVAAGFLF
jgi:hypothetical protein